MEIFSSAFKKVFKGKIESVSSRVDPSTRAILARVIPLSLTLSESLLISIVLSSTLTANVLLAEISPPPVSPSPAVRVTEVWFTCSFVTKLVKASWSILASLTVKVTSPPITVSAPAPTVNKLFADVISSRAVAPVPPLATGRVPVT